MKAHVYKAFDEDETLAPCTGAVMELYDEYGFGTTDSGQLTLSRVTANGWMIELPSIEALENLIVEVGPVIVSLSDNTLGLYDIEILDD